MMNASIDLIYSTLDRNAKGFGSNEFRCEIEKLSLEELNQYIDKFHTGVWEKSEYRDEKLRLCLRLRNAHLLRLPWFYTVRQHEYRTTDMPDLLQYKVLFFFLNFKSEEELTSFKNEIQTFDLKDINVIFLMNEHSYGQPEMQLFSNKYPGYGQYRSSLNVLLVKDGQYNHLVNRNLLQDIFNYTFLGNYEAFPCVNSNDLKFTIKQGNVFFANRYPEQEDIPQMNFKTCLQLLYQKMGLIGRTDFTALLLIEVQSERYGSTLKQMSENWDWIQTVMGMPHQSKLFVIKGNHEMQYPMRLSLVASMNS